MSTAKREIAAILAQLNQVILVRVAGADELAHGVGQHVSEHHCSSVGSIGGGTMMLLATRPKVVGDFDLVENGIPEPVAMAVRVQDAVDICQHPPLPRGALQLEIPSSRSKSAASVGILA